MKLFLNDLSLHGQFQELSEFRIAIAHMMRIRDTLKRFDRELYCHRHVAQAKVTPELSMPQAVQSLNMNEQRAVMSWITRHGPFWDDARHHNEDDYFECDKHIVTDSALAEAAYHCYYGANHHLVSFNPSDWLFSPIMVSWFKEGDVSYSFEVDNHWDERELEKSLQEAADPVKSWEQLAKHAKNICPRLFFSEDSFESLSGHPFVESA